MYLLQTCIKSTGKKWVKIVTEYINTQSTPETSRNIDFSLYRWAVIVNCWFCCIVWTYDLLYIMSSFVSQEALFVRQFIVCRWKICWLLPIGKFVARRRLSEAILSLVWHGPEVLLCPRLYRTANPYCTASVYFIPYICPCTVTF